METGVDTCIHLLHKHAHDNAGRRNKNAGPNGMLREMKKVKKHAHLYKFIYDMSKICASL